MSSAFTIEYPGQLKFFRTPEYECNYLPDREAGTLFTDPSAILDVRTYSRLALIGFRRSGRHLYTPRCRHCNECVPIRLPIHDFQPNRTQRRTWKKNQDLTIHITDHSFRDEHYILYKRYLQYRHPGGKMSTTTPEKYQNFLQCNWMDTRFVEFRLKRKLLGIAVTDFLIDSLSSLYTFYDPDHEKRSLGTFGIMWQIEAAQKLDMKWLYLGYWVEGSRKMNYKIRFKPHEIFIKGLWQRHD